MALESTEPTVNVGDISEGDLALPAVAIVGSVALCTVGGGIADVWLARRRAAKQDEGGKASDEANSSAGGKRHRPVGLRFWVIGMLVSSYALLIPGLFCHLFVAGTDMVLFHGFFRQNLSSYDETMITLIGRLASDGMIAGSLLVMLYAIVIPMTKLCLLGLGQYLEYRASLVIDDDAQVSKLLLSARRCTLVVQAISKWACPDMFAYILLMYLMRALDNRPDLESDMVLDLGFTCFCIFCVASTVSSLGIRPPPEMLAPSASSASAEEALQLPAGAASSSAASAPSAAAPKAGGCAPGASPTGSEVLAEPTASTSSTEMPRKKKSTLSTRSIAVREVVRRYTSPLLEPLKAWALVLVLMAGFVGLVTIGMRRPSMSLRMDMDLLYKVRPDLADMRGLIDSLNLGNLLHKEVSVWQCILKLWQWIGEGEVNSLIAFVMYAGFAVLLPIVDMTLLVVAASAQAYASLTSTSASAAATGHRVVSTALRISKKARKMAMLDVSIMGCFVVVMTLASMRSQGVIVELQIGTFALFGAELCRYGAAFTLNGICGVVGSDACEASPAAALNLAQPEKATEQEQRNSAVAEEEEEEQQQQQQRQLAGSLASEL